ncbi:glycosyltransferase family protein [Bosea sp. (in: a-proteobacteria)]|jgi:predicted glycosyltransferase|uniref:glycosyltransferase family protein n=1 Tax=Bosea sp. (in: a-proteobacteria) TaxID=1871050 RepID=UPI003F719611
MTKRVLIAVTHLLGSGHLVRAMHLAQALSEAGYETVLVSGGVALRAAREGGFSFVQLPPVKVEGVDFRNLLDEHGAPIDDGRRLERRTLLAGLAARLRPDLVITEHFPFGRRQLAGEFLGLIEAAKAANPKALVLASIRDVLVTPRADRVAEVHRRVAEHFDAVLVHGDAGLLPLEASWPVSPELARRLHYTGYLTGPEAPVVLLPSGEIVVSGGGSGASLPLFDLAIAAAGLLGPKARWRILAGQGIAEPEFARLQASAPGHVTVERARADFLALLAGCAVSISQAGYNTVLDLVRAGRPAIVVPFDAGNETEQAIRAEAMARAGLARCLRLSGSEALTPEILAAAVERMLAEPAPRPLAIDRDGARNAVSIIARLLLERD